MTDGCELVRESFSFSCEVNGLGKVSIEIGDVDSIDLAILLVLGCKNPCLITYELASFVPITTLDCPIDCKYIELPIPEDRVDIFSGFVWPKAAKFTAKTR